MQIIVSSASDVGRERERNEDRCLVDEELGLFVVADGMGGHAAGDVAASICTETVHEYLKTHRDQIDALRSGKGGSRELMQLLEQAIQEAGQSIYRAAQGDPEKRGMGTTCSLLLLLDDRGIIAHVGDSRIYLIRQGSVYQLSEDHSLISEMVRAGQLESDQIEQSPFKDFEHAVTRAVGVYEQVAVDTLDFDLLPGDEFLLCSDGLHNHLDSNSIVSTMQEFNVEDTANRFIALANEKGGDDNITSIVVRVGEADTTDPRTQDISQRLSVLRNVPIFRYLNYKEIVRVMNIAHIREAAPGEMLFEEGLAGSEMFVLLRGTVRLTKGATHVTDLESGAHFGEMALVDSAPRSTTATAQDDVRLLVIYRRDFFGLIRRKDKLSTKILWSLVKVLTDRLRKTTAELTGALQDALLPDFTDELQFDED